MQDLMHSLLNQYKTEIQKELHCNLIEISQCNAVSKGQKCKQNSIPFSKFCSKHCDRPSVPYDVLVYHNHVPGLYNVIHCPACQMVGINS